MGQKFRKNITAEQLRKLLRYDPVSGGFVRLVTTSPNAVAGMAAGTLDRHGFRQIQINGVVHKADRLAWLYMTGEWPSAAIEQIDADRGNYAWLNLRMSEQGNAARGMKLNLTKKLGLARISSLPEYRVWIAMRVRCGRPSAINYQNYGGRGIRVCDAWKSSFEQFYEDMGPRPTEMHSIDRIDNDGNYEPGNCRWATKREQLNHTRRNRLIRYHGKLVSVADAWRKSGAGVALNTVYARLGRGIDADQAIDAPRGEL